MKQIWIIAMREFKSFFDSLMAYILITLFLLFTWFFTWIWQGNVLESGQADLRNFFNISRWTLFIFIPAITMKMISEERRSGTIELLLTKPLTDWQFVTGKFLSSLLLIAVTLGLTLVYYFSVWGIGPVDHGEAITGYFGLLLLSSAYISIGLFCSSITKNQIEAFLLSIAITLLFHLIFDLLGSVTFGIIGETMDYLSVSSHYRSITRGVVDTKDLIYFVSIVLTGLFLAESNLAKRNYGK